MVLDPSSGATETIAIVTAMTAKRNKIDPASSVDGTFRNRIHVGRHTHLTMRANIRMCIHALQLLPLYDFGPRIPHHIFVCVWIGNPFMRTNTL
jgi:hypothetical protein